MNHDRDHRVTAEHRSRAAVVYVRQSSPEQVRDHGESTRIQRGLRERAIALGWRHPTVIDDDLGISAGGYAHRPGFKSLLARVAMEEIGIIFCLDASRLSRNSKDWAHLFELCCYFNTLIADLEQVYDLSHPNDRLVMGIKGTMSEMELTILRARMKGGREEKASRGELRFNLPAGYVHDPTGKIVVDPDQRVEAALRMMFERFDRCTSVRQLGMWYRDTETLFPIKKSRAGGATLIWDIPPSRTLYNLLLHPIYAGAYVWGRRITRLQYHNGELVRRIHEERLEDCRVCLRDHHPAYISWDRFQENCSKIHKNRPRWRMQQNPCAIREGLALLAGLLRCGDCGGKIYVNYKAATAKKTASALYYCDGGNEKGSRRCGSFGSHRIDQKVSEELTRVCQPWAIEAALTAAQEQQKERQDEIQHAELQVQAAQYEADRSFEQFDGCDPRNRLVADTLEERLNEKLVTLQTAQQRLQDLHGSDEKLTEEQQEKLQDLARDFPTVWNHPQADPKLKKQILRTLIQEIIVQHQPARRQLEVTIHWEGGVHTQVHVDRPQRLPGGRTDPSLVELVRQLAESLTDAEIARILNLKKTTTPRGLRWTQDRVMEFRRHHQIREPKNKPDPACLTQNEALQHLQVSRNALLALVRRGAIKTNQVTDFAPWRISRSELDSDHVQALVRALKETGRLPKGGSPKNQATLFDVNKRVTTEK